MAKPQHRSPAQVARRRRETVQTLVIIAILAAMLVYGVVIQIQHHL